MPPLPSASSATIRNFGKNVAFTPEHHAQAASEAEVLEILRRHRGQSIRAYGSLHAWSSVAATEGVAVNVAQMNAVSLQTEGPEPTVTVQGGCQIKRLLAELNEHGWTTPTLGLITEQTIAGATATATHGSGRHCLSHYILSLRLATYDAQGEPVIQEISGGEELRAACCSLGTMGIVTQVVLPIRPQYWIEEHLREHKELDAVIAAEEKYPLQQFFFLPWKWTFLAQHRRETQGTRSRSAFLYRRYWGWIMDHGLHWVILALARWLPDVCCPFAFRVVLPALVPRGWRVVDRSDRQLTMQHQAYRHVETELFVQQSQLAEMIALARWVLTHAAGKTSDARDSWLESIKDCDLLSEFEQLKGRYRHHYPICIRKVLSDRAMISMSGSDSDEAWYAVSFICYASPEKRHGFFHFSRVLTTLSGQLLNARPHWGKWTQLPPQPIDRLYPHYETFVKVRDRLDPTGAFRPAWIPVTAAENASVPPSAER